MLGHAKYGNKLVLVEIPSFGLSNTSDWKILEIVSQWMTKTYVGILFMRLNS